MKNLLKEKMQNGTKTIGTFHQLGSATGVECLGYTGLDYVVIDAEHGPFGTESTLSYIRAAKIGNITPLVRVKDSERNSILKMLDVGAMGLIIPNIHTVDEVRNIVKSGKYYPLGERGVARASGSSFGYADYSKGSLEEYFQVSNQETLLIPQCETRGFLDNIEEIVNIEGIDGIFVGPYDLSTALGKPGNFEDDEVKGAFNKVVDACRKAKKYSFIYTGSEPDIKKCFDIGFDSVTYKMDANILVEAYKKVVSNNK